MTYLDSSFMAPMIPIAEPGLTMEDMCDRICEAIQNLTFAAPMVSVTPSINVPAPYVEFDLSELSDRLGAIEQLLAKLITAMAMPMKRTIIRDEKGLIQSVIESR